MDHKQATVNNNIFIYNSKLARWDQQASVRVKPQRIFVDEESTGKVYFPPELVPTARHHLVSGLGDQALRTILIQRLYTYLDFTAQLEHDVVNHVTHTIARGKTGITFPWEMVFDAHKIYCDEAYHALFSVDLAHQIEVATGVQPHIVKQSRCLIRLQEIVATVPQDLQLLATIFFSIVSETLITAILSDIPKDRRVMQAVRAVIADHAEDEGRHHAYFARVLEFLWPRLGQRERKVIGPLLPQFILAFLEPDYAASAYELASCDLTPEEVQQIIYESYPRSEIQAAIKAGSQATIRHFQRTGLFEDRRIMDAFQSAGLID